MSKKVDNITKYGGHKLDNRRLVYNGYYVDEEFFDILDTIESLNFIPSDDFFYEFLAKCKRSDNDKISTYYYNISQAIEQIMN